MTLLKGLRVPGDLVPVEFTSPTDVLVCETNDGVRDLINEARSVIAGQSDLVSIIDAKTFFQNHEGVCFDQFFFAI